MSQIHPRLHKTEEELIPPFVGRSLVGVMILCLALVAFARWTDRPLEATPPVSAVIAERPIVLFADMDGSVRVFDDTGTTLASLSPDEGGFISGVARVLARERQKHGLAPQLPVSLTRHENGRLALSDPATGWSADLMGFGLDNARAFARLLD
jgi:putative photosynthetic complex assembly protein